MSNMTSSKLAPIVLFVYNRPQHLRKTLVALKENPEFSKCKLYVYCDGPKSSEDIVSVDAVHNELEAFDLDNMVLYQSEVNQGLGKSIINGVTEICKKHGRAIVLEDDLEVSNNFIKYMNDALNLYNDDLQVMQVAGHCFPAKGYGVSEGSSFLPFTSSWGWATWDRAWKHFDPDLSEYDALIKKKATYDSFNINGAYSYTNMIKKLRKTGNINRSWAVRWYWSVFKRGGLVLFPHRTLVKHFGNDDSGTNYRGSSPNLDVEFSSNNSVTKYPEAVITDVQFYKRVRITIAKQQSVWNKGLRFINKWV